MLKTQLVIATDPDLKLRMRTGPIDFELGGEASLTLTTGPIHARIDEIPITLRIPFLRHHGGRVVAASLGPFGVRLAPIEARLRAAEARVHGVLGRDGIGCEVEGAGKGKVELDLSGKVPGKIVKAAIEGMVEE